MNKKRFPVLLVAILYIATKVSCQESTSVFNFLSLPYSAHVTGLGGHNISLIEDDITLVNQNLFWLIPACIGFVIGMLLHRAKAKA